MKQLYAAIDEKLVERVELLDRMTASARSRLPRDWAEHCWVVGHDATCLNMVTDNAVFITPLFYQQAEILKQLNEEFGAELRCRFKRMKVRTMREPMPGARKAARDAS